ncbi:hypothetical protein JMJ35_007452 [Cladonia borealis]|uniref:FAD-binding PCMH-type domain-containing protein n=1 Tax=Cladonia borealis TaxID=184061 RepID=A0AA39UZL3_9LECA|nr:hypothetical protein JMJ35_007452 [Cladonia borealis]
METIQDFTGLQYPLTKDPIQRKTYDDHNVEYATSSHQKDHDMFPGLIAMPKNDDDIIRAIKYAKSNGYAVSVMSGGHQYSGACSTHGKGIQLNLRLTYKAPQDLVVLPQLPAPDSNRPLVYASVSHSLGEFNTFLKQNKLFVPHGQCTDVHLGGHGQTGGYGQLARAFGLLGDHIWGIRMIDHSGEVKEVTKKSNPELFYAITGGSPGNFGIITHWTIEAHRDQDHDFPETGARPHGFKGLWLYNETVLKLLLNEVAAMADDLEMPRNFDLCCSVLSSSFPIFKLVPELDENRGKIRQLIEDAIGVDAHTKWPACVVLYAQWVPMSAEDLYTKEVDAWFQKFRNLDSFLKYWCIHAGNIVKPMSQMTGEWLFTNPREFDHPYEKRTYMTNSTTLAKGKWVDQVSDQINQVIPPSLKHFDLWTNCFLSIQIQAMGGKYSQYFANRNNGTAYSWRDSTVCQDLDCFHVESDKGRELALGWQAANDKLMVGENSAYSKKDKRVLWASYGDWNMDKVWPTYYEDREKYERIGRQRYLADPQGTFTPNPFCVKAVKH